MLCKSPHKWVRTTRTFKTRILSSWEPLLSPNTGNLFKKIERVSLPPEKNNYTPNLASPRGVKRRLFLYTPTERTVLFFPPINFTRDKTYLRGGDPPYKHYSTLSLRRFYVSPRNLSLREGSRQLEVSIRKLSSIHVYSHLRQINCAGTTIHNWRRHYGNILSLCT